MSTGETCPVVGPLPACYLVAIGYFLVALSAISPTAKWTRNVFFIGWTPVAVLAGFGSTMFLLIPHGDDLPFPVFDVSKNSDESITA